MNPLLTIIPFSFPPVMQGLAGTYFLPIVQSIWANRLLYTLRHKYPNIDPVLALNTGSSELRNVFHGADLAAILNAYMVGIKDVFAFSLACAAVTVLVAMVVPMEKLPVHQGGLEGETEEKADDKPEVALAS